MEERVRQALERLFGEEVAQGARLQNLGGHASLRIYWRVTLPQTLKELPREEHTLMAMVLPQDFVAGQSDEAGGEGSVEELPFVTVQRLLKHLSLPVPALDALEMDLGVVLLEDLGEQTFEDLYLEVIEDFGTSPRDLRVPIEQLYHRAINLLVDMQASYERAEFGEQGEVPDELVRSRRFDAKLLRWELDHYREWGLQAQYGEEVLEDAGEELSQWFDRLVEDLLELPQTMVLRDYQSRNIMNKQGTLHLIDFQDALMGPMIYDLVSLLRDSYIELPYLLVHRLVEHYTRQGSAAGLTWCDDPELVQRAFNLQTVQRKLKDAGRFIFIDRVKGNPDFFPYYKTSVEYARQALEMLPEYEEFGDLLSEFEPAWHNE